MWTDGTTYYAEANFDDGSDYSGIDARSIIQSAIDALTSGGRVFFRNGTYPFEYVQVKSNITLEGESQEATILQRCTSPVYQRVLSINGEDNITIKNFTLDGNGAGDYVLIYGTNNPSNIRIESNTFKNFGSEAILFYETAGATSNVKVTNNTFTDILSGSTKNVIQLVRLVDSEVSGNYFKAASPYAKYAIWLAYPNNCVISNNTIDGTGAGITTWTYTTTVIENNVVANNIIRNLWNNLDSHWAILTYGNHTVIQGNVVSDIARDGIVATNWYGMEDVVISGNTVSGVAGAYVGIWVHGMSGGGYSDDYNIVVTGNTLTDVGHGIVITHTTQCVVAENIVDTATDEGIQLYSSDTVTVVNNILVNCVTPFLIDGGGTGHIVKHNQGYVTENTGTSTGTGGQQTIAHGCDFTPTTANVLLTDIENGAAAYCSAAPDAANIYVTAVVNQDYRWEVKMYP